MALAVELLAEAGIVARGADGGLPRAERLSAAEDVDAACERVESAAARVVWAPSLAEALAVARRWPPAAWARIGVGRPWAVPFLCPAGPLPEDGGDEEVAVVARVHGAEARAARVLPMRGSDLRLALYAMPLGPRRALQLARVRAPQNECTRRKAQCDLWAYVWGSTAVLASWLARRGRDDLGLAGASALEVGAGSGAAGLAAAAAGARVLATDLVDDALALTRLNCALNGVGAAQASPSSAAVTGVRLLTAALDWNNPELNPGYAWPPRSVGATPPPPQWGAFDLVLAADVVYMSRAVPRVAALAALALRPGGAALLVDPGRPSADDLPAAAEAVGLVPVRRDVLRLRCAVCDMPKATLFVLVRTDGLASPADAADAVARWTVALDSYVREDLLPACVPEGAPFAGSYCVA